MVFFCCRWFSVVFIASQFLSVVRVRLVKSQLGRRRGQVELQGIKEAQRSAAADGSVKCSLEPVLPFMRSVTSK